jgi:hypothetical protein
LAQLYRSFLLSQPRFKASLKFSGCLRVPTPLCEFTNFGALTKAATQSGANVVITAPDGHALTLKNVALSTPAGMSGHFTFHP